MVDSREPETALIVHAHPEGASFCTAQMRVAQGALESLGCATGVIDLYARGWDPVLGPGEFQDAESPFKPQREQMRAVSQGGLAPEVREDLDSLLAADLLVLSFPLWWFSVPAILKGWVDRVFVMGGVFGGDYGTHAAAALAGKKAVVLATTGGSAEAFTSAGRFGSMGDFLFHVHRGILEFVGYEVIEPILTYGPAHMDESERALALRRVEEAFAGIGSRPTIASRAR